MMDNPAQPFADFRRDRERHHHVDLQERIAGSAWRLSDPKFGKLLAAFRPIDYVEKIIGRDAKGVGYLFQNVAGLASFCRFRRPKSGRGCGPPSAL